MSAQLVSMIVMFLAGVMVGAAIDCIRTLISYCSTKSIIYKLSYIIEVTFWIILGGVTFYLLFLVKGGDWRAVDALAQILGIFAYDLLFQRILRFIGRCLVNIIFRPIFFVAHIFVVVIRNIVRMAYRGFRYIGKYLKISKE